MKASKSNLGKKRKRKPGLTKTLALLGDFINEYSATQDAPKRLKHSVQVHVREKIRKMIDKQIGPLRSLALRRIRHSHHELWLRIF